MADSDITTPGVKITNYKMNFYSLPLRIIECELANRSKLEIFFITEQTMANQYELYNYAGHTAHKTSYGFKYLLYFTVEWYEQILSLLRNEKELLFTFGTITWAFASTVYETSNGCIRTTSEPIGEDGTFETSIAGTILYLKNGVYHMISDTLKKQMELAKMPKTEIVPLISKMAELCKIRVSFDDLSKIIRIITIDAKIRADFLKDPQSTARKIGVSK